MIVLWTGAVALAAAMVLNARGAIVAERPGGSSERLAARDTVLKSKDQQALDAITAQAKRDLRHAPLDTGAMSLLGMVAEAKGDQTAASALMEGASTLSHRDGLTNLWLFAHRLEERNYEKAFLHGDALLRVQGQTYGQVFPILARALNDPAAIAPLAQRLAKKPYWRQAFVAQVVNTSPNPEAGFLVFSALQDAGGQPTAIEMTGYINRLVSAGMVDRAYLSWVLFMPKDRLSKIRYVYDGDFEGWEQTPPFSWNFGQGVMGSVQSAGDQGRKGTALRVEYDGVSKPTFVSQLLFLPEGPYQLSGDVLTATREAPGRLGWQVVCADGRFLASALAPDTDRAWRKFTVAFVVPTGCGSQWLAVKPVPAERRVAVEIWYDKIAVDPTGPAT